MEPIRAARIALAAATYAVICLEEDGAVCYISRI